MKNPDITTYAGININTIPISVRTYHEGGIEKLKEIKFYTLVNKLNFYKVFLDHLSFTATTGRVKITELTGIT